MRQISHRCKIDTKACFRQIHWSIVNDNVENIKYAYNSKQNTSITSSSSACLTSERISLAFQHNSFFSILSSASYQTEQSRFFYFIFFKYPYLLWFLNVTATIRAFWYPACLGVPNNYAEFGVIVIVKWLIPS